MAGIGLDAAVVGAAHAAEKRRLGWVAYAVSGVAHLSLPPREFTVRLDGGEPLVRRARCVVVGNAGLLPGGFWLLPEARCDDGWLDVGILAPTGVLGWPRVAGLVLTRSRRRTASLSGSGRGAWRSAPRWTCRGRSTGRSSRRGARLPSPCAPGC